jgi:hypothetical protein
MNEGGPLSLGQSSASTFLVGRNSHGEWVVRDEHGLRGGLFVNRAEALKYALFENGRRRQAVIMVPGILELNLASGDRATSHGPSVSMLRKAA